MGVTGESVLWITLYAMLPRRAPRGKFYQEFRVSGPLTGDVPLKNEIRAVDFGLTSKWLA
jgi:hypothetical protein